MTNSRLRAAVEYWENKRDQKLVFVIPFPISAEDVRALRNHPCCASMILQNPAPSGEAHAHCSWLGSYADDGVSWKLPENLGTFIVLGPSVLLTRQMLKQVAGTGARSIVCEKNPQHFVDIPLFRFYLWHLAESAIEKLSDLPAGSPVPYLIRAVKRVPGARALWHRVFRRNAHNQNMPVWETVQCPAPAASLDLAFFRELLRRSRVIASTSKLGAEPKRFILVNAGLAAGGAERQIVNTLRGLKSKGFQDICLIGEYLRHSQGLNFYLPLLESAQIAVHPLLNGVRVAEHGFQSVPASLGELLARLPGLMAEEILNLVEEFKNRRPAVVHAWQDSTSIKVGLAAVIAGVPRIVLASRNVTPVNFGYYQEYMRAAYQALSEVDNIIFINNSSAGAVDYCRWLEIPQERFQVVRNGVDFTGLTRVDDGTAAAYRDSLGIPQDVPVVGSIFRFWAEKRPLLWLDVAREVAKSVPDAHFLLIGDGPMRKEMEKVVRKAGLEKKVHMPGARADIATPLSSMTAFLLTSEFEGTPNVVLEAQWLGVPVIAIDAGGTREAIDEGITGWCCSPPDAVVLAAQIKDVLSDSLFRQQLRQNGPRFVQQRFSIKDMIDRTLRLYGIENESESASTAPPIHSHVRLPSTQVEVET